MAVPEKQVTQLLDYSSKQYGNETTQVISLIRQGLPASSLHELAERYQLSERQLAQLLGVSTRTLSRLNSSVSRLSPVQSDRLFRLARIVGHAESVFDTLDVALDWLKSPNRALAGSIPLSLLDTDAGTLQVDEILTRIEYGVYS